MRILKRVLAVCLALLVAASVYAGICAWRLLGGPLHLAAGHLSRGQNGVWMGHRWFDDTGRKPLTDSEIEATARRFRRLGVRWLFIHAGPLDAQGRVPHWHPKRWERVRDALRSRIPGVKLLAYLGGLNQAYFGKAPDTLDLASAALRRHLVATCRNMLKAGFDGIHYDIELIRSGDPSFLALLSETRRALPASAPLSVATPHMRPPGLPPVAPFTRFWTPAYYRQVGQRCDQIAYMGYDTMMPTQGTYSRFMRWQVRALLRTVPCRVLVGVPTYKAATRWHDPRAETLRAALRGVAAGACGRSPEGVAVFANWTTTPGQWDTLKRLWVDGQMARRPGEGVSRIGAVGHPATAHRTPGFAKPAVNRLL